MKKHWQRAFPMLGLVFLGGILMAATASAAITMDGRLTPGETYQYKYEVQFSKSKQTGDFYVSQDGNILSVLSVLPKGYVDNTYGQNAFGWDPKKPNEVTPGKHKLSELIGSDASTFALRTTTGQTFLSFKMDYVSNIGDKNNLALGSTGWGSMVTDSSGKFIAGEGKILTGSASQFITAESSMGYNFDRFGASNPEFFTGKDPYSPANGANPDGSYFPLNPAFNDWVYEVAYEFQVDVSGVSFDPSKKSSFLIVDYHASPKKADFGCAKIVPEPSSLIAWSVLTGLGLVGVTRKRRPKTAQRGRAAAKWRPSGKCEWRVAVTSGKVRGHRRSWSVASECSLGVVVFPLAPCHLHSPPENSRKTT